MLYTVYLDMDKTVVIDAVKLTKRDDDIVFEKASGEVTAYFRADKIIGFRLEETKDGEKS